MIKLDQAEHFLDAGVDFRFWGAGDLETEGDVVVYRHVGEQRVGTEHHADIALVRLQRALVLAVDGQRAAGRRFEAGDHAQDGRLAAARRSEEGDELTLLDRHVEVLDDLNRAEGFLNVGQREKRHEPDTLSLCRGGFAEAGNEIEQAHAEPVIEKAMTASAEGS